MMEQKTEIIIGKPRSKTKMKIFFIIVAFFFLEWALMIGWFLGHFLGNNIGTYLISYMISFALMGSLYTSIMVRENASWLVTDTELLYNDDGKMTMVEKIKSLGLLFCQGYYTMHLRHFSFEKISYIHIYYRKKLGLGGALVYPFYFKIYLDDGTVFDAPFRLDSDGKKIYDAFQFLKSKDVFIHDPQNLLEYLKNNKIFDEMAVKK